MNNFEAFCKALENKIINSYSEGITLSEAEKLAGEFLHAQLAVSHELSRAELSSRMRRIGVKSIRAAIYLDIVQKSDKKPTETQIASMIDVDKMVNDEQTSLDSAEVERDTLKRYYDIFLNAHIYYRGVAKGSFQ